MVLRVGVVGVGRWGTNHARVLAELQEEGLIEFSAVCDVDEVRARQVAKRFGVPLATTSLESFARSVDAAIIATPMDSLYPVSRKLLEQGIDLLIEKPVATTSQEVRELRK
ncbi:MAG TPA: Gfo/Idh/MocA family oxidoreductase, partial [Ignisphaera aggregans]|nr:Gfo/Idh/MocA family oxidoreductase [Ignisphaera aggregans]